MFDGSRTDQLRPADYMIFQNLDCDRAELRLLTLINDIRIILPLIVKRNIRCGGVGIIGIFVTFFVFRLALDQVTVFLASGIFKVGRDRNDIQQINFIEFFFFGQSRTGHAGDLVIHPVIILQRDGCIGHILRLDLYPFFRFNRLMQTVGPTSPRH